MTINILIISKIMVNPLNKVKQKIKLLKQDLELNILKNNKKIHKVQHKFQKTKTNQIKILK